MAEHWGPPQSLYLVAHPTTNDIKPTAISVLIIMLFLQYRLHQNLDLRICVFLKINKRNVHCGGCSYQTNADTERVLSQSCVLLMRVTVHRAGRMEGGDFFEKEAVTASIM